jgi:hypothetical protein
MIYKGPTSMLASTQAPCRAPEARHSIRDSNIMVYLLARAPPGARPLDRRFLPLPGGLNQSPRATREHRVVRHCPSHRHVGVDVPVRSVPVLEQLFVLSSLLVKDPARQLMHPWSRQQFSEQIRNVRVRVLLSHTNRSSSNLLSNVMIRNRIALLLQT